MAIFMDNGGGDIYAGPTKEAAVAALLADCAEVDIADVFEVPAFTLMRTEEDRSSPKRITLAEAYGDDTEAYCICSENC